MVFSRFGSNVGLFNIMTSFLEVWLLFKFLHNCQTTLVNWEPFYPAISTVCFVTSRILCRSIGLNVKHLWQLADESTMTSKQPYITHLANQSNEICHNFSLTHVAYTLKKLDFKNIHCVLYALFPGNWSHDLALLVIRIQYWRKKVQATMKHRVK